MILLIKVITNNRREKVAMNRLFSKGGSFLLILCIIIGCAGMNDSTRTKAEGTGFGAATGALVGGLLGQVIGHDSKSTLVGAAIGAAVGGGAGYLAGDAVEKRKAQYANAEDRLDGEIKVVAQYNNDLKGFNEITEKHNEELAEQVAVLKSKYEEGNADFDALNKKKDEINLLISDSNKREEKMNKELVALNKYYESVAKTMDQTKVTQLAQQISILKKNIAMLDENNKQMAKINSSIVSR
jgi:hypothetical protein